MGYWCWNQVHISRSIVMLRIQWRWSDVSVNFSLVIIYDPIYDEAELKWWSEWQMRALGWGGSHTSEPTTITFSFFYCLTTRSSLHYKVWPLMFTWEIGSIYLCKGWWHPGTGWCPQARPIHSSASGWADNRAPTPTPAQPCTPRARVLAELVQPRLSSHHLSGPRPAACSHQPALNNWPGHPMVYWQVTQLTRAEEPTLDVILTT